MSTWGHRQQVKIILTFVIIVAVIGSLLIYFGFFNKAPNCFDNKQNGDETGVDCGGSCLKICLADSLNPIIHYTRIFEVTPGRYTAVAGIENPNSKLFAENVSYTFRVYDKRDVVLVERKGAAFIAPNKNFPIFEGALLTGNRVPARVTFQFNAPPIWRKASSTEPVLNILNQNLTNATSSSRLEATLENQNPYDFKDLKVVGLIYDSKNNVIAASETLIDSLPRRTKASLVFTWPESFESRVNKIDIVPLIPLSDFIPNKP